MMIRRTWRIVKRRKILELRGHPSRKGKNVWVPNPPLHDGKHERTISRKGKHETGWKNCKETRDLGKGGFGHCFKRGGPIKSRAGGEKGGKKCRSPEP